MRDLYKDFIKICSATNKGVAWSRTCLRPLTVKRRGSYPFPGICTSAPTHNMSGVARLSRPQTSLWVMPDNPFQRMAARTVTCSAHKTARTAMGRTVKLQRRVNKRSLAGSTPAHTRFSSHSRHYGACSIHVVRPPSLAGQPYKTLHPLKSSGIAMRGRLPPSRYDLIRYVKASAGFVFKTHLNRFKCQNLTQFIINIGKHMIPMRVRGLLTDKAARKLVKQHLEGWRMTARKPRPLLV